MNSRAKIESILRSELDRAIRCQWEREHAYRDILIHVPHEGSSAADADHLQAAFLSEMAARNETWRARQRLSDFLEYGWIPDDLRRKSGPPRAAHA